MLQRVAAHSGDARSLAFGLPFEATARRRGMRPKAAGFGVDELDG
jgi:hypothetical protein